MFGYRDALRTAQPYTASVIAYGTGYGYNQGVLCYFSNNQIRLLDVCGRSRLERVIDATGLMSQLRGKLAATGGPTDADLAELSILSYSDNTLVCMAELAEVGEAWLFVVDVGRADHGGSADARPRRTLRLCHQLSCTTKLFVRQNGSYLYYGTHSGLGSHGHHEWLIQGFDLSTAQPVTLKPIQLVDFVGSEIGSTACFEIHGGSFYAVSNQTSFEVEEVDWTSYYQCIKIGLDDKKPNVEPFKTWRRQHIEGPINDSWTDISLQKDEQTDEILIVECRREWLGGGSANIRTYYTKPLELAEGHETLAIFSYPANDPLTRTLDDSSKPNYMPAERRLPRQCHPEYPESKLDPRDSTSQDFILAKTKFRGYNAATSSFIDLVNDPAAQPGSVRLRDRIRLRVASRLQKSPLVDDPSDPRYGLLREQEPDEEGELLEGTEEAFHPTTVRIWPPNDAPPELFDVLCPGGRAGQVEATADERSIVYMTGPSPTIPDGQRAIVLINFDPTWKHSGLATLNAKSERGDMKVETDLRGLTIGQKRPHLALEGGHEEPSIKRQKSSPDSPRSKDPNRPQLVWTEDAMYLSINRGFRLR